MATEDAKIDISLDMDKLREQLRRMGPTMADEFKKALGDVGGAYASAMGQRRAGAAKHGSAVAFGFTPEGINVDEQIKELRKKGDLLKKEYVRVQGDLKKTSFQKFKGLITELIKGPDHDTIDQASQSARSQLKDFHQQVRHDMVMFQQVSHAIVGQLPGGGIAMAGISGFANSFANARSQNRGVLGGLVSAGKGLAGGGAAAAIAALAAGIGGGMQGLREDEGLRYQFYKAGGFDPNGVGEAMRSAHHAGSMTFARAAPTALQALGATGSAYGVSSALRAEVAYGQGGAFSQLLGATARTGGFEGGDEIEPKGRKNSAYKANEERSNNMLRDVVASGFAQGLKVSRFSELIAGATQAAMQTAPGVLFGGASSALRLSASLGQDKAFQGERGFGIMQGLNTLVSGKGSPISTALALRANGLGKGKNLFQAQMGVEEGIFGGGGDDPNRALDRVKAYLSEVVGTYGSGNVGAKSLESMSGGAINLHSAQKLLGLYSSGQLDNGAIKEARIASESPETKAYKDMSAMAGDMSRIDKMLEEIKESLGKIFKDLGGEKGILSVLRGTENALEVLTDWLKAKPGGYTATTHRKIGDSLPDAVRDRSY